MDALCTKPTAGHVKKALATLRSARHGEEKLARFYEQAMERINGQDDDSRVLAHQVLSWVTHAIFPLTSASIQHALATTFSTSDLDLDFLPDVEYMVSICAGLITVDGRGFVHWIHYTTQEYFEKMWEKWLPGGNLEIARTCLAYLSFESVSATRASIPRETEFLPHFPLYSYAARYWGEHMSKSCKTR